MTSENTTPITQDELERKLNDGESLKGVVIGDADFSNREFNNTLNFSGAVIQGTLKFWKSKNLRGERGRCWAEMPVFSESQFFSFSEFP